MISVDVVFITYNQEQYVAQGMESILSQKVSDDVLVKIIIADDCSADNTLSIIKSYEDKSSFPFVYTSYTHNIGMRNNYKYAFELCKGDYIAILEGDDYWHECNHIQQHVDFLESHIKCSMSFNQIRTLNAISGEVQPIHWPFPDSFSYYKIKLRDQIEKGNFIGNLSACVFRNLLIKTIPDSLYKSNFADWELSIWMAQYGFIGYLKGTTSTYRIGDSGLWTKLSLDEKKKSMLQTLVYMDDITKHKYHKWFKTGIYNIEHDIDSVLYVSWKTRIKQFFNSFFF